MMILNQAILALQFSLFLPTHLVPSLTSTKRANLTSRQTQNCLEQDHKRLSIALIGCDSQFQSNSYFSLYFLPFLHSILTSLFSVSLFSIVSFSSFLLPLYQCDQKKSPNVYKSCPKMISLEKLKILTPLQKLP